MALKSFASFFKGKKSKQALEQELFSLENQSGMIKHPIEMKRWVDAYVSALTEYENQFGKWNYINWWKWAKN